MSISCGTVQFRVLTISDALLSRILLYERRLGLSAKDDLFTRKAARKNRWLLRLF
jgi:hypothetical protein